MDSVWLVVAVDWEDFEVRGVLSTEEAAIAFARDQAQREARKVGGDQIIIERHPLDPAIGDKPKPVEVDYTVPSLGPPGQFIGVFMGSVGISQPIEERPR